MSFRYTRISFLEFCRFSSPSVVVVDASAYRKSLAAIHFDYLNTVASPGIYADARWNKLSALAPYQIKQALKADDTLVCEQQGGRYHETKLHIANSFTNNGTCIHLHIKYRRRM